MAAFLPVIDLQNHLVVHGVAGHRDRYQPVQSVLTSDPTPAAVAAAFAKLSGVTSVYVADLDALAGGMPDWHALQQIAEAGLKIWLDAGLGRLGEIVKFQQRTGAVSRIIAPLESATDAEVLAAAACMLGEQGVFSLDLRAGRPVTAIAAWQDYSAEQIAACAVEAGFQSMIVLDVAAVGIGGGPSTTGLCRELHARYPQLELVSGGGVRHREDVAALAAAGCSQVLVASALHSGQLP